ncbi:MAG: SulP family sulfate permease [Arenicella sp.]
MDSIFVLLKRFIPILEWLPNYKAATFKKDLPAGITIGIIMIPQGLAYAMIAGLPPIYGLYAALLPQVIYAILGTSRQLSVGPVAMDSLLVASGIGALKLSGIEDYISVAIFLALFMGCIQLLLGVLRMGFLVNFLSRPIISGFTSAAALIIGFSQLKYLTGAEIDRSNVFHNIIANTYEKIGESNMTSIWIGLVGIIIIFALKKWKKSFPGALIVVIASIVFMYLSGLDQSGVDIVGGIPEGLPSFQVPTVKPEIIQDQFWDIAPFALALALVAFTEAISIGKSIEHQHDDYKINPNQELRALGISNIIGSFFMSYPTTASFSRSAINNEVGAKTGMASIIGGVVIALTLLFLTPLFFYLPKPILASVVMVSVFGLIDIKYAMQLLKRRPDEFISLIITFLATLFIGIIAGIIIGILFSLLLLVYRTAKPHIAELGRIGESNYYKNLERFGDTAIEREDLLIIRFDSQLYFGNTEYFKSELTRRVERKGDPLVAIILNAESINYIDSSGAIVLCNTIKEYKAKNIQFFITGAIGPTRDIFLKSGVMKELGEDYLFVKTHEAVDFLDKGIKKNEIQDKIARQTKSGK